MTEALKAEYITSHVNSNDIDNRLSDDVDASLAGNTTAHDDNQNDIDTEFVVKNIEHIRGG